MVTYTDHTTAHHTRHTLRPAHSAHIVSFCSLSLSARRVSVFNPSSVHYCSHDTDTADLYHHFQPACHFIHSALEAGHAALIHCQQGISRSAAIATAYLIRQHGLSLRDAYVRVKASRPTVKVSANFLKQLIRWEKECREEEQRRKTVQHLTDQHKQGAQDTVDRVGPSESAERSKRRRVEENSDGVADGVVQKEVAATKHESGADVELLTGERVADEDSESVDERHSAGERGEVGSGKRQKVADEAGKAPLEVQQAGDAGGSG